jgi:chromosome segregation ATPase
MRAAKEIEKAYHRASMARESSENLAVRSEALAEQNKSLAAAHSGLVATAEEQRQRLEWLEQRLSASAVHVDAQAERATQVALERSARLEAELWKLKWQLEQSEEDKEQQAQKLRKTTEEQHSLGAPHAQMVKQHADDVARLHQAEAEAERLRDEVGELRSSIARDCTGLHGIARDCTGLHLIALNCTQLHGIAPDWT